MTETKPSEAETSNPLDIWQADALSTFASLIFRHYEVVKRTSAKTKGQYKVYRVTFSPVENPSVKLVTELFQSDFDKIRALRIIDDKANIKVSVEGKGRDRVITWSNVSVLQQA